MGNKLCKKKGDVVDNASKSPEAPSKFDRIFTRLHLKPTTWKSESHLHKKESSRAKSEERGGRKGESIFYTKPISKSSDWTDAELEVPDDDHIHLPNPKLNLIFDNDNGTPTPPPRNKPQKPSNFRERIEKIATKGLQAFQGDKSSKPPAPPPQAPVEEPLMVKKKINYVCPICESDEKNHNRNHHHPHVTKTPSTGKKSSGKRQKNLSVVSLPNYTDLKLSVAHPSEPSDFDSKNEVTSSRLSLQQPKKLTSSQSTGKLDSYITRCRSFGSIFPQQLKKLKVQKVKPEDHVTSDDSFGPLEDWDVGLIEHYNPKDASLPRPRKPVTDKDVLSGIEGLIVKDEDVVEKPRRPIRRSESLVKKINKEASEASKQQQTTSAGKTPEDICLTPPPSPVHEVVTIGQGKKVAQLSKRFEAASAPEKDVVRRSHPPVVAAPSEGKRESVCEHSSLMKILQEFSVKDKQEKAATVENESEKSSLTPSLVDFEKNLNVNGLEDFIKAEKRHSETVCS